jgi:hypothetical protein
VRRRTATACLFALLALAGPAVAGARTATVPLALGGGRAPVLELKLQVRNQSPVSVTRAADRAGDGAATVTLGGLLHAPALPDGFLGLSIEYPAVPLYAEAGARFDQVLANLAPGQRPIIRVGGDSTDHATILLAGRTSEGLWDHLGHHWLAELRALALSTRAHMVMGVNLEVNRPDVPITEARAFKSDLGASLGALELGNEPELYSVFPWDHFDGQPADFTRTLAWSPSGYIAQLRATLPGLGDVPLWGPSLTATSTWWTDLGQIADAIPHLSTITAHAYPTDCYSPGDSARAPSVANLLAPEASAGLAAREAPEIAFARATHRAFRIDEINTVSCNGARTLPGFASTLWAVETGFALAQAGVSGVNIHTFPFALTRLFTFSGQSVRVSDEYSGWMLFARAAPPGSRLLSVGVAGNPSVQAFATRSGASRRVVLLNQSADHGATVTLSVPHSSLATVEPLRGAGLSAAGGVSFAGLRIAPASGELSGHPTVAELGGAGRYSVWLPPASADLISFTP